MTSHIISIAGGSGSGKTTISQYLKHTLNTLNMNNVASILSIDDYYHHTPNITQEERNNTDYDHPDAISHKVLKKHIHYLIKGKPVPIPIYEMRTNSIIDTKLFFPTPFIILEGIFALYWEEINSFSKTKIFIDIPYKMRFNRIVERDIKERGYTKEEIHMRWEKTVQKRYLEFILPTKENADLIIYHDTPWDTILGIL